MIRIYLDNCCYNRPYDDNSFLRIRQEAEAKIEIQNEIKLGKFELVSSYILEYENDANTVMSKKEAIKNYFIENSLLYVSNKNKEKVEMIAKQIMDNGIKEYDALHMACAIVAKCDYFITTDRRVLKYQGDNIKTINPINFYNEFGGEV